LFVNCAGPPTVQVYPGSDVRVDMNGKMELDCLASGRPEPTVTWTRAVSHLAFDDPCSCCCLTYVIGYWSVFSFHQNSTKPLFTVTFRSLEIET